MILDVARHHGRTKSVVVMEALHPSPLLLGKQKITNQKGQQTRASSTVEGAVVKLWYCCFNTLCTCTTTHAYRSLLAPTSGRVEQEQQYGGLPTETAAV